MTCADDAITIALSGGCPATDAFGLDVEIDGRPALMTVMASGPGLFRTFARAAEGRIPAGHLVGFLQRGPLLLPVTMPEEGWLLATAPDGARVGHGSPILRILPVHEGILP